MKILDLLQQTQEPSIQYQVAVNLLNTPKESPDIALRMENVKNSTRVKAMFSERSENGIFMGHPYQKWKGPFYTFLVLSDLGYPSGDVTLIPQRDQILDWLLDKKKLEKIPYYEGRYRRCALIDSGAVVSLLKLGIADSRVEEIGELLLHWQWPDGGWNCDKRPQASTSSFHESLIPLRAMHQLWQATGDRRYLLACERAAEFFLKRRLLYRVSDGSLILPAFSKLAFPSYWHYDFLSALSVMAEVECLNDPRCSDALDLLESKQLENGGFPAEHKYYKVSSERGSNTSYVDWGPVGKNRMNEFVTVKALAVLLQSGRINLKLR